MFRGKESSNRIELSRLVQNLLNFGVLGSLRPWGWGGVGVWGWGLFGGCPTHMCTCTHTHAHTHAHARVVNMKISCKWLPPLGKSLGIPYDVIRACACVHARACACVCTCVRGTLSPPPTHIHPPPHPPGGAPPESIKIQ